MAGFGGGIILLPILSSLVGIKHAVPLLTVAQLFGNFSRIYFGWKQIEWKPIVFYSFGTIPFSLLGAWLFVGIDAQILTRLIGLVLIGLVLVRKLGFKLEFSSPYWLILGGCISGMLSSVSGVGGPIAAMMLLNYGLSSMAFIATEASTAIVSHTIKIIMYSKHQLITSEGVAWGSFLGLAMIAGSYSGKKVLDKLSKETFTQIVEVLLALTGMWFLLG